MRFLERVNENISVVTEGYSQKHTLESDAKMPKINVSGNSYAKVLFFDIKKTPCSF